MCSSKRQPQTVVSGLWPGKLHSRARAHQIPAYQFAGPAGRTGYDFWPVARPRAYGREHTHPRSAWGCHIPLPLYQALGVRGHKAAKPPNNIKYVSLDYSCCRSSTRAQTVQHISKLWDTYIINSCMLYWGNKYDVYSVLFKLVVVY